ncbi:thiamine-phosphate kinase [Microbacterium sp. cx-55]|uniref:thiamine-phosphate kinase n=1 Tax=Microbacterium sp. cx-55 TaxID=2875948 RepID=UPI001CBE0D00|nr:thiamine-phosphate kinase [Microbacterium sp. cx-55]MBZ4486105.1 thiamine-phosphate kinase [Microbacterium sp. cx-55]UGB34024.1 thiamine-phosphate kinase [Microbacterium sp. cx-55]
MTAPSEDPTVGDLSEGQILRRILSRFAPSTAEIGPGDDAAVIGLGGGRVVATVDTLVHGPDFRLAWTTGYDLGWKSAVVNLADVAAMGARPVALLVALAMPEHTRISFVEAIADGLRAACEALAPGCAVEGGDLTISDTLTVAVTALGALDGPALRRSGAQPGDTIALAGAAGDAARGLQILFDRFRDSSGTPVRVDDVALTPAERDLVAAQLRPHPPLGRGPEAARAGATAMMDVSDGLLLDATRMADASGVTLAIDSAALGPDAASALSGGEDHALLATFPPGSVADGFRPIGVVRERGEAPVLVDGAHYAGRTGWDPYRDWDSSRG